MLTVGVLGTVAARRDGVALPVPAGKTTELLARLALDAGAQVRADVLLDELWPDRAGRNTLQSKVSQLRRALGDREAVAGTPDGYRLDVLPDQVDALRVDELARAAAKARAEGDAATALELGAAALELFQGDVLPDAGDWANPHRARLEELRLGLLELTLESRADLGAGAELVAELEMLVERYPLREGLWATLITALYRSGRQADALAAYARLRALLLSELGVDPSPRLRALEQDVLTQRATLAPPTTTLAAPGNLPPMPTPTVGREAEATATLAETEGRRLVTLLGPAGVGKSRLALEVAHRVQAPGGVWWVRLDAVEAPADLPLVVAETLHVPGGAAGLHERLSGARTVLVLDGCEHVAADVGAFVTALLDAVPSVGLLATSQVPLGLPEEHTRSLSPLGHDDAVALFTDRASAARPVAMDDEAVALVDEVCRSLDGLPLAIELAAARVRSLSLGDLARRLDDRLALLRDPSSTAPERRRTLAGAIAWSYDLLFPDDQRALWALASFADGAVLDAAQHVMVALDVPATSVVDSVTRLVDRSLVVVDARAGGGVRYRLLDSIRAYALTRLAEAGAADVAASAHADWYASVAEECDARVRTDAQGAALTVVRDERADVDAALSWCATHDPARGQRIAARLAWSWVVLADGTAGAARLRAAVHAAADLAPDADRAHALLCAGWLEASAGDVAQAQTDLDAGAGVVDLLDDDLLVADLQRHQAFVCIQQGRPHGVLENAAASLAAARALGLPWRTAASLLLGAFGSLMVGDTVVAGRDARKALSILVPLGDAWGTVHAQAMLGGIAQAEGRTEDAARALSSAADSSVVLGFPGQAALHRATLARVQQRAGDPAADASYRRAIAEARAGGDGRLLAQARLHYARLLRARGDSRAAQDLLDENALWYAGAGGGDFALLNRVVLASLHDDDGDLAAAAAAAEDQDNHEAALFALDALARIHAQRGEAAVATDLLAEADSLRRAVGHVVDENDRVDAEAARSALRALC